MKLLIDILEPTGTGIYWNFDLVVYLKMKNILENILEYTEFQKKIEWPP